MTQATADAIATTEVRIRDERGAIALLESLGRANGTDARFARSELAHYGALLTRLLAKVSR